MTIETMNTPKYKYSAPPVAVGFHYAPETIAQARKVPAGTVSAQAHNTGLWEGEPLTIMMDCLIKYASSYKERFEQELSEDYILGPLWLESAKGVRGLLNGDGANAMRDGITTDSKDNGAVESMFWDAMAIAGFTEADL